MKRCSRCKEDRSLSEFNKNKGRKDGLQDHCRPCDRLYSKERYEAKRDHYVADSSRRKAENTNRTRGKILTYLRDHPCVECGETDPVVLEFDHRRDKIRAISQMVARNWSWTRIEAEIEKCEVRCANCHRRRTAAEQGWYSVNLGGVV